jgi:hypothetical protein
VELRIRNLYPYYFIGLTAACSLVSLWAAPAEPGSGWIASSLLVDKLEARDSARGWITNFREEDIPPYALPELLTLANGCKVIDAETWETQRRPEILELFKAHSYGRAPIARPEGMTFNLHDLDRKTMSGAATRKQIEIRFTQAKDSRSMNLVLFLPNNVDGPVPTFLLISHRDTSNLDPTREKKTGFWPAEALVERGYGVAAFYAGDLDEDEFDEFKDGVHAQFDAPGSRPADAWARKDWKPNKCPQSTVPYTSDASATTSEAVVTTSPNTTGSSI